MDDQNQTNQPLDQGTVPSMPSMPLDITPQTPPVVTPPTPAPEPETEVPNVTPLPAPEVPVGAPPAEPVSAPTPPVAEESVPASPWTIPEPTEPVSPPPVPEPVTPAPEPMAPPVPEVSPVAEQAAPPTEPVMPGGKPKKKIMPVVMAIAALLLVTGVAGAAYYISNQLSTRQAVAPTAPESKPMAAMGDPTRARYCSTYFTYDCNTPYWVYPDNIPVCVKSCWINDPGPVFCWIEATGCPGEPTATVKPTTTPLTCDENRRDPKSSNTLTFAKTGKVRVFMKNSGNYIGTVTLKKAGVDDIVIPYKDGSAVEIGYFNVSAGDVYELSSRIPGDYDNKDAYGWIPNEDDTCGPIKTPGVPNDANSKPTGYCGEKVPIGEVKTLASNLTDLSGITAGGVNASIQCWGDADDGDATTVYDYNDFAILFGYEKDVACVPDGTTKNCNPDCPTACGTPASTISTCTDNCGSPTTKECAATAACDEIGACVVLRVYNFEDEDKDLTTAQLQELKVGDKLSFYINNNMSGLRGKLKITSPDGVVEKYGNFISDQVFVDFYQDDPFIITSPGQYKFEGYISKPHYGVNE